MSPIYQNPADSERGETSQDADPFQGRFVELVPGEKIVWFAEFGSQEPGLMGEMRIIWSLADGEGGTDVNLLCDGIAKASGTKTMKRAAGRLYKN